MRTFEIKQSKNNKLIRNKLKDKLWLFLTEDCSVNKTKQVISRFKVILATKKIQIVSYAVACM